MSWERKGKYSAESDAGYRISWSGLKGTLTFTAWAPGRWHAWSWQPIGYFSGREAREQALQACEKHLELRSDAA